MRLFKFIIFVQALALLIVGAVAFFLPALTLHVVAIFQLFVLAATLVAPPISMALDWWLEL